MDKGLKRIAVGVLMSHERRLKRVAMLNAMIDDAADALRSPTLDGMPHGSIVSDSVSSAAEKIEKLCEDRAAELVYINAVEWARAEIRQSVNPDCADVLVQAVELSLMRQTDRALYLVAQTSVSDGLFRHCRQVYLESLISFLRLS